jgi:hypothetical protein
MLPTSDEFDYDVNTADMVDPSGGEEPDDESGEGFEEDDEE